jgi:glycosyltransferase involved in cell wall biosynthesis
MKISVVIPCFNEEKNIEITVNQTIVSLKKNNICGEIIVVDDGSKDNTCKIAEELNRIHSNVSVIVHKKNKGLGQACLTGFNNSSGEWVTWLPGDGQFYPEDMINMCDSTSGVEFAIGTVPITERIAKDNLWRFVLSKSWRFIIKVLLQFDAKDIVGYAFHRKLLSTITLISSTGFLNIEFPIKAIKSGVKVKYYNIRLKPRLSGKSKVNNISTIIKSFWEILKLRFKRV